MPKIVITAAQRELEKEAYSKKVFNTVLLTRKAEGMDHQDLAAYIGVTPLTVSKWKADCGKMTLSYFRKLAETANLTDSEILQIVRGRK